MIATAGTLVPTITGTTANQRVAASGTITPFAGVTIGDLNLGQTETLTVTLSGANGTLTNLGGFSYDQATGNYTVTGTAAAVSAALNGLIFTPAPYQVAPGQTVTTVFTISDTDSALARAANSATSVIATVGTVTPTISGTTAAQSVAASGTILPFANVVIGDRNFGQTETVTVTLSSAANGFLSNLGSGHYDPKRGVFTDTGLAAAISADLHGLTFNPTASLVSHGQTLTTGFTLRDTDSALASVVDNTTTVTATAGASADSLIMLQSSGGQLALWQISGSSINSAGLIGPALGSAWFSLGTGTFYPGDTADIVLQNRDGTVVTWQVRGTALIGGATLAKPPPAWHVRGTGDFYGDGASDILLQNDNGSVAIWEAQAGAFVNAGIVAQNAGATWHVVSTGDFYRDGKADILLQNDDGSMAIWEMQGSTINKAGVIAASTGLGPAWHVKGTGDFYADGATDLVLQNDSGSVAIWEMNGTAVTQAGFVSNRDGSAANPGPTWHVVGTGDFNNQGNTGIVLQSDGGDVAEWQLSGTTVISAAILASPGPAWSVFGSGDGMRFIYSTGPNEILAATPTNPDEFVFTKVAAGWHTITGFSAIQDRIELSTMRFPNFASVQQAISPIAGGTMISLSNNTSVLLPGVDPKSLHASNFVLN